MKSPVEVRELAPRVETVKGVNSLFCPFCDPTHVLIPGKVYECGTTVKVTAVQTVYNAHGHAKKITCLKCGKGGGQFVMRGKAFIHAQDCMPGTRVLAEMPEFSRLAKYVYKLPIPAKKLIERFKGRASALDEIGPDGKKTGVVLGYFFWSGSNG